MRFNDPKALVQELKAKVDLVDFIGRDLTLAQKGMRWIGLCPFHNDSNPSFAILPARQGKARQWGCHACKLSGDLIDYVQQRDKSTWHEAIVTIVEATNFDVSNFLRPLTEDETHREGWARYLRQMAQVFHDTLVTDPVQMFYLTEERGIGYETLRRFLIGYCPSVEYAVRQFSPEVLSVIEPNRNAWDGIFGGHILIPQFNPAGQIWGWFARRMNMKPKYMGTSSASPLFDAHARLYGLAHAKKLLSRDKPEFVIVEGFFDVLAAQEAGFPAIATCGTGFSEHNIQTLHDHAVRKATFVYDGDEAGREAMLKIALSAHDINGLDLKFGRIPGDPDEYISERGVDAFSVVLKDALCAVEFVITHYAGTNLSTVTAQTDFYNHAISYLASLPRSGFSRQSGISLVSKILDTNPDGIMDELDKLAALPLSSQISELSVLAEFAFNPNAFSTYPQLKSLHFTVHSHRMLFDLMVRLYQSGSIVNIDLLRHEIASNKMASAMDELVLSLALKDRNNVERYVTELVDRSARRQMHTLFDRAKADLLDLRAPIAGSVAHVVEAATKTLIGETSRKTIFTGEEAAALALSSFEQRQLHDGSMIGLDLGPCWKRLMSWTGGLRGGRLYLVAAASGIGKTNVLLNWIHALTMAVFSCRAPGLVASMEMSVVENYDRLIAMHTGLPYDWIARGAVVNDAQLLMIKEAIRVARSAPLTWMTGQRTVAEIAVQARMLKAKGLLEFIGLDYIQLLNIMCYPSNMPTHEKYATASQELKDLADALDVPILMAAQLNRAAYEEFEPSGQHMGSALKIYQDAHMVYMLAKRENGIQGILDKNRDGAASQSTLLMRSYEPGKANLRIWEQES